MPKFVVKVTVSARHVFHREVVTREAVALVVPGVSEEHIVDAVIRGIRASVLDGGLPPGVQVYDPSKDPGG